MTCTSVGLWSTSRTFSAVVQDCFPEGEVMNLLLNFFEGSFEGIMGKETEGKDSSVKWEKTGLEGVSVGVGEYVKILSNSL